MCVCVCVGGELEDVSLSFSSADFDLVADYQQNRLIWLMRLQGAGGEGDGGEGDGGEGDGGEEDGGEETGREGEKGRQKEEEEEEE